MQPANVSVVLPAPKMPRVVGDEVQHHPAALSWRERAEL